MEQMLEQFFISVLNMSLTAGVAILAVLAARLLLKGGKGRVLRDAYRLGLGGSQLIFLPDMLGLLLHSLL